MQDTEAINTIDPEDISWMDISEPVDQSDTKITELTRPAKQPSRIGQGADLEPWEYGVSQSVAGLRDG